MDRQPMIDVDFHHKHRVRWRETDASGFVHFTNYIRFMEQTEYAFLRSLGLSIVMQDENGVFGFPRRSTDIQIQQPATVDDCLDIWMKVTLCDGVKIGYRFEVERSAEPIASGEFLLACCRFPVGAPPRAILIPDLFLNRFPTPAN